MRVINKVVKLAVLLMAFASYSTAVNAEKGLNNFNGMSKTIVMIDKSKRIIKLADNEFSYDKNTVILNNKKEPVTDENLKKGDRVRIELNTSQRYISRPVLKLIHIESSD